MMTPKFQEQKNELEFSIGPSPHQHQSLSQQKDTSFLRREDGKPKPRRRADRTEINYLEENGSFENGNIFKPQKRRALVESDESEEYREKPEKASRNFVNWSEEDDKKIFMLFKEMGAKWTAISKKFRNKTENEVKNRFYSTLRRVATKICGESGETIPQTKEDLVKFVDIAIEYGHECKSKRGRKGKGKQKDGSEKVKSKPLPRVEEWEKREKSPVQRCNDLNLPSMHLQVKSSNQILPPIASLFPTIPPHPTIEQLQLFQAVPFFLPGRPFALPQEYFLSNPIFHQSFYQ